MPAALVMFGAELLFFSVADSADAICAYSSLNQGLLAGVGAIFTKGEVVFGGTALVAIPSDDDFDIWMSAQISRILGDDTLIAAGDVIAVVVEEDILDVLAEAGIVAHGRCGLNGWSCRGVDGHPGGRISRAACASGDQMVVGR